MQSSENKRLIWLAEMYQRYSTDLQRYIYSKVGEPFLAEDLTSTVFLKALRWMREDQSEESARGWLYATARTTIADHWQVQGQYETQTLAALEQLFSFPQESAGSTQQTEVRVHHLLSLLSERERRVLTLRYLQGYSASEIAQALGTNAGHIRVLQLRALKHAAQVERQEQKRKGETMQEQEAQFNLFSQLLTAESQRSGIAKGGQPFAGVWGVPNPSLSSFSPPAAANKRGERSFSGTPGVCRNSETREPRQGDLPPAPLLRTFETKFGMSHVHDFIL